MRSKATDLTLIPLIQWEVQQDNGDWRDLKDPKDPWDPYSFQKFTLNITIGTGKNDEKRLNSSDDKFLGLTPTNDRVKLETVKEIIKIKKLRTYDSLRELDIEINEESLR